MIQDLEAIVDESGKVRLLAEIRLKESRRALVTILDEAPEKIAPVANVKKPTNESVSDDEVLGVWADRTESAQEIARKVREDNRKTT